jgi:tRNA pseudouridine55 synthase
MRAASSLTGILLIDKPQGWTSHDVVAKARGITGQRRIGHTGTLDPMATGLLVLCLGQATRLVEYMVGHDKRYEGEIHLGVATDTDDADGKVTATGAVPAITGSNLADLSQRFSGTIMQRPPAYSAVKIAGKRAYAVARAGGSLELAERSVAIHQLELELRSRARLGVRLHCGPGTYVRSLARDIGEALGCGAHLSSLRRTTVGRLDVGDAIGLEALGSVVAGDRLAAVILSADEGIAGVDAAILTTDRASRLANGQALEPGSGAARAVSLARIYGTDGAFVGTGSVGENGEIRPLKVLSAQDSL